MKFKRFLSLSCLAALLVLALGMFGWQNAVQTAHAMDCEIDCYSGLPPTEVPDPTDEPPDGGGGGDPGLITATPPPGCTPAWAAPSISAAFTTDPAYPLTTGQDPDDLGVTVSGMTAHSGASLCPGYPPATIIAFSLTQVRLADSSIAWITGELSHKYPGAHVLGMYPFVPPYQTSGLGSPAASLSFHFDPLDPGYYEVHLLAVQSDGQQVASMLSVPVHLMESAIIQ